MLSVSALRVRLEAVTGVKALLSTNASESGMNSATAIPAPRPDADESAFVATFVLTFELIVTALPGAEIVLVPERLLWASASTKVAASDASWSFASVHGSSRPLCVNEST